MLKNKRTRITAIISITLFLIIISIVCLCFNPTPSFTAKILDCNKPFFSFICTFIKTGQFAISQSEVIDEAISITPNATNELNPNSTLEFIQTATQFAKSVSITSTSTLTQTQTLTPTNTATPTLVAENVYFVATDGSNENPGTKDLPWRTLHYASARLRAGDTLYIRGGTYQEIAVWEVNGREDAPITIMNFPGETVIIDGYDSIPSNSGGFFLFTIRGDWYVISGLEIKNSFGEGGVVINGSHVTIKDCFVHHNWGGGITIMGDYGFAQNNRIWYNGRSNEYSSMLRGGWPAAITCARYPSYCTLKGNISWENWGEGISTFEAYYSIIEDNISFDNMQNIYVSDTKFSIIQRNLVYCSADNLVSSYVSTQNGILVGDEKQNPPSSDNQIINNIVYGCNRNLAIGSNESTNVLIANNMFVNAIDDSPEAANVFVYSGSCTNCRFVNNIILQENAVQIGSNYGVGWEFSHNLWSRRPSSRFKGVEDIIGNPLFSKNGNPYSMEWYQLKTNSPAINNAIQLDEVTIDYSGFSRPLIPDIGALEFIP